MRLFCALDVPQPAAGRLLERTREDLAGLGGARVPEPSALHLTLVFLGEVGPELAVALRSGLVDALAGRAAPRALLGETGSFPGRGRERVLWVAPREEPGCEGRLAALHEAAHRAARAAGWRPPGREKPFRPHLSVARLATDRRGRPQGAVPDAFYARRHAEAWRPGEVVLYESRLGDPAARYVALGRYPLDDVGPSPK